jgi:hypothetical protein
MDNLQKKRAIQVDFTKDSADKIAESLFDAVISPAIMATFEHGGKDKALDLTYSLLSCVVGATSGIDPETGLDKAAKVMDDIVDHHQNFILKRMS